MNSRAILFVFLSTLIMMLAIILRPAPDVGQFDNNAPNAEVADANPDQVEAVGGTDADGGADADDQPTEIAEQAQPKTDGDETDGDEKEDAPAEVAVDADEDTQAALALTGQDKTISDPVESILVSKEEALRLTEKRLHAQTPQKNAILNAWNFRASESRGKLVSIGSLAADSDQRYLFTVNSKGGTLRRAELNSRDAKGRMRYRDSEIHFGYLGSLELSDSTEGCVVGIVGDGTPAFTAVAAGVKGGIAADDIITQFNDQPVSDPFSFELMLGETKAGDKATIGVIRAGKDLTFEVVLTNKPIELMRPEPDVLEPGRAFAESFALALLKPYDDVAKNWETLDEAMQDGEWEITQTTMLGRQAIEAKFVLSEDKLAAVDLKGPIEVVKRYILPTVSADDLKAVDSRSWHWDFEIEVYNRSAEDQKLGFSMVGPTGTPSETWWYANKIFGGSSFMGVAGARDVSASTTKRSYQFLSGNEILTNTDKEPPQPTFIISPFDTVSNSAEGQWNWVGVDSQYFNVTLLNVDQTSVVNNINAVTSGVEIPENSKLKRLVDCSCLIFEDFNVPAGGSVKRHFEVFAGPKEHDALVEYGLDDNRAFGWFWWCSKPLLWLLGLLYFLTGSITYSVPIILLTIAVRCLMIPFSRKAALNAQMMQALQPQMKEITDKYEDLQERGLAQRELFKKHNYQPLGGCLVMFIQLPIFLGLYRGLSADIALRDQPLIPGVSWCSDLSAPDQFWYWKDLLPGFLAAETGWLGPYLNILPLITIVLFLIQQKMFTPPAMDEQAKMMQKMMGFVMLFMGVMFFKVPSGLCLYFITSSIWGILEKKLLPPPKLDTSELSIDGAAAGGAAAIATLSKAGRKKLEQQQSAVDQKVRLAAERKKKRK